MGFKPPSGTSKIVKEFVERLDLAAKRSIDDIPVPRTKPDLPPTKPKPKPDAPNPRPDGPTPKPDSPNPKPDGPDPKSDPNRSDRGDGRDNKGRFTGDGGYGKDYEKQGLDALAERRGVTIERKQVKASVDGVDNGRLFDGLIDNGDGTWTAVEVKGGTATRNAAQRAFDNAVNAGTPAYATLDGVRIKITSVILEVVP